MTGLSILKKIGYDNNSITKTEEWIALEVYNLALEEVKKNKGTKLTRDYGRQFLEKSGFTREETIDRDGDKRVWWIKNGISIHEDEWNKDQPFAYATYIKSDGSFKSGFTMQTDTQVKNLYFSLCNKEL